MRVDEQRGRSFDTHLRDAYEALEVGHNDDAERAILAAWDIDPCALAAVQWWNFLRAEAALAEISESELLATAPEVNKVEVPAAPVEQVIDAPAIPHPPRPSRTDWRKVVWERSKVVWELRHLVPVPSLAHAALAVGVCALVIASVTHLALQRSRGLAPVPSSPVTEIAREMVMTMPAAALPQVEDDAAEDAADEGGPRWLSPRLERLGVSRQWRAAVIGLDDRRLLSELQQSVGQLWVGRASSGEHDAIILEVSDLSGLDQLSMLEPFLKAGGVLWVLHPVNNATITQQAIKAAARDANLTYRASTRLTPTAIAEKLVRPRAQRARS